MQNKQNNSLLSELIEELEVRCRYGVKQATGDNSKFGVLGDDKLEENPSGCKVVLMLKDI